MLLANKKAIQSLLNERKPFNHLCKYFGISNQAMRIRLFNLFYFQTAKQVIEEEKNLRIFLSTHSKQLPTIFIKTIN